MPNNQMTEWDTTAVSPTASAFTNTSYTSTVHSWYDPATDTLMPLPEHKAQVEKTIVANALKYHQEYEQYKSDSQILYALIEAGVMDLMPNFQEIVDDNG